MNDQGQTINKFNTSIFRLQNATLTANYSISSSDFDKSKKDDKENGNGANNPTDTMGANIDPTNRQGNIGRQQNNVNKKEMSGYDNDVSEDLRDYLRRRGIKIYTDKPFKSIKPEWL